MTETAWARLCAASGAPAIVLLIAGNEVAKIGGGSPPLHASPSAYADAVGTPAASLAGGFLVVLGLCLLVPFVASLAGTFGRASGDHELLRTVLVGGGLVTAAVGLAASAPLFAAGVLADDGQLDPTLAKTLLLMNGGLFVVMWATSAIYVGATAILVLRTHALPRLIGWSGALLAPALVAASLAVWEYDAAFLAWALTMLWIIATSIAAAIRAGEPRSQPAAAPIRARSDALGSPRSPRSGRRAEPRPQEAVVAHTHTKEQP
jgi:hypothetical protein